MSETLPTVAAFVAAALAGGGPLARSVVAALTYKCTSEVGHSGIIKGEPRCLACLDPEGRAAYHCSRCHGADRLPLDTSSWPPGAVAGVLAGVYMFSHRKLLHIFYYSRDPDGAAMGIILAALEEEGARGG
ncbi:MAG: hypothetical protein Q8R28_14205 [Dehalococcoidia bacterium]|nr:hypothetical protein [Dehalococcoidia bacterium]